MSQGKTRKRKSALFLLLAALLLLVACSPAAEQVPAVDSRSSDISDSATSEQANENQIGKLDSAQNEQNEADPDADGSSSDTVGGQSIQATATEPPTAEPTIENTATTSAQSPTATPGILMEDGALLQENRPEYLRQFTAGWVTNWEKHTVEYEDFLLGGPPRDGIRSLDEPQFVSSEDASIWLAGNEPVIALEVAGEARAYPLQILTWHEIVNDTIAGQPIIVTFCPLCNSAIVFNRQLDDETLEFGTSGLLRNSDLVMYDRSTESLWQQFTGEAIVGDLVGQNLEFLPSSLVSFADFLEAFPKGQVLSQTTGFDRPYGVNPYAGYDTYQSSLSQDGNIVLLKQEQDRRLPAAERVVTVSLPESGLDVAYPLSILSKLSVINDRQAEHDLVIFFKPGTSSALGDQLIAIAEDVGATAVFDPNLDEKLLTFSMVEDHIIDDQTSSTWNMFGQATAGELAGSQLYPIIHGDHFWFSWAAFKPETLIYEN